MKNKVKKLIRSFFPSSIWQKVSSVKWRCIARINNLRYFIFGSEIADPHKIPVIINNYNRLDFLKQLVGSLESCGMTNIHIIDNDSTYQPLLDYYNGCKYDVIRLDKNVGYLALWKTDVYKRFWKSYYIYTDPDLVVDPSCPRDFIYYFLEIMKKYPLCQKIGFGLRIDNIPDFYPLKSDVIDHEKSFWSMSIENNLYIADIDTTFALYRPYCKGGAHKGKLMLRTGYPYVMNHLPWYLDPNNLSEEEKHYLASRLIDTEWTRSMKNKLSEKYQ